MTELNVCFVGIGSIAKRHIRNLKEICAKRNISLKIDALRHTDHNGNNSYGLNHVYTASKQMQTTYDIIFITNPTEYHLDALNNIMHLGRNFFIEKPICSVSQLERLSAFNQNVNAVYYVACPLRYHAVIQYIKENVHIEDILCVRSISSSYLPDWRPGTDYRESYSAHKSMGGGVDIDLIHEWDYLTFLLGKPQKVSCLSGKKSDLEIDSNDYAVYIADYGDKIAELHLDYFGRKTLREILLFTKEDTILVDLANNQITYLKSGKYLDFREQRDDYQIRELEHFLNIINKDTENDSCIEHAASVLKLTQGAAD